MGSSSEPLNYAGPMEEQLESEEEPESEDRVAEALDAAEPANDDQPSSHGLGKAEPSLLFARGRAKAAKIDKLKPYAGILTAVAALLAALGAFLKTFDHSVTKDAYEALSLEIVKLGEEEQRTQTDLANLRGYLDGISRAPLAAIATPSPSSSPSSSPAPAPADAGAVAIHPFTTAATAATKPPKPPAVTLVFIDAGPPPVHAPTFPVKPPPFADTIR